VLHFQKNDQAIIIKKSELVKFFFTNSLTKAFNLLQLPYFGDLGGIGGYEPEQA
jgi:hypothetical protein